MTDPSYLASPIKRARRTKVEVEDIRAGLFEIVEADNPMTVRQAFYQAVVTRLVDKTEAAYESTVARLLLEMRRSGRLPYEWIADNTRWMRKSATYSGLGNFIKRHQQAYRRDLWAGAEAYVEVWCEKDALAGVMLDSTDPYGVPLMISRGFASESYLHGAADAITDKVLKGKQAFIYFFGDHDPSGLKISASIEAGLRRLCEGMVDSWDDDDLVFERVAVTPDQIIDMDLPTRPTKTEGNRHARTWEGGESVELDAIPAGDLRQMVTDCIEAHVDARHLMATRLVEAEERDQLRIFGEQLAA